jgi:hypothetical protein
MGQHLPEILSPGFNIQDKDLLQPKSHFNQVIGFEEPI